MRNGQHKTKEWGNYTEEQAQIHFDRHGFKCTTLEDYTNWFKNAERGNFKSKAAKHFCNDCLLPFKKQMTSEGRCILALKEKVGNK